VKETGAGKSEARSESASLDYRSAPLSVYHEPSDAKGFGQLWGVEWLWVTEIDSN
jgi:hypothetical protein